jgi:hypothetical protein
MGAAETYFNARDTNADVRCLDHADIICTITNGKKNCLEVLLDQFDDERFLERRNATCGASSK